jgi:uncharacterized damage-inducible protein DinB
MRDNQHMSALTNHARSMLSYNRWANERILRAARDLSPEQFEQVRPTLNHTLGTQRWWFGNWTGADSTEPDERTLDALRSEYEASHADLHLYGERLTDEEWSRTEAWWKRWGYDAVASVGMTLFQVVYHGIQHRSEVAVILTEHGVSPGDLDYLQFLQETALQ